jgi:uncharacterized protein YbjQ (UPF0145 family)
MSNLNLCKTCRTPKAPYTCGICQECTCKKCTQFLSETFSFSKVVPESLKHTTYCMNCFDDQVAGPLADYQHTMEAAKEIIIFRKEQSKVTRLLRRKADPYQVEDCEDEDEALMRMSFMAVKDKYNCLIDISLTPKKIVVGSHKKTIWSGTAVPITIDPRKVRGE